MKRALRIDKVRHRDAGGDAEALSRSRSSGAASADACDCSRARRPRSQRWPRASPRRCRAALGDAYTVESLRLHEPDRLRRAADWRPCRAPASRSAPKSGSGARAAGARRTRCAACPGPVIGHIADQALVLDLRCLEDGDAFVANLAKLRLEAPMGWLDRLRRKAEPHRRRGANGGRLRGRRPQRLCGRAGDLVAARPCGRAARAEQYRRLLRRGARRRARSGARRDAGSRSRPRAGDPVGQRNLAAACISRAKASRRDDARAASSTALAADQGDATGAGHAVLDAARRRSAAGRPRRGAPAGRKLAAAQGIAASA